MTDYNIIVLEKYNEVYVKIYCNKGILQELSEYFTFYVPGYKFMPSYKNRIWDGKYRLVNLRTNIVYLGLVNEIKEFCDSRNYEVVIDPKITQTKEFSKLEAEKFISTLKLPFPVRDYQLNSFIETINSRRIVIVSATGSGKSLILYLIIRFLQQTHNKCLLIVPNVSLVKQMYNDFIDYGYDSEKHCHMIFSGQEKESDKFLYISTFQSLHNIKNVDYFKKFSIVLNDETHRATAKSITNIMEKCVNAQYRIGTTGSLDNELVNTLIITGLFGPVFYATKTSDLIKKNQLSNFIIKCIVLKHTGENCKALKRSDFQSELKYLITHKKRNHFISKLVSTLKNNTLILFNYIEHGKVLYNIINSIIDSNRKVFLIYGDIDASIREEMRKEIESNSDAIVIASYGVYSTGINIKNLHNVIFASPSKSRIRNLQSIGRILRLHESKDIATLYDISDDLRIGSYVNHTLNHLNERIHTYNEEKFEYKIYNIDLS